MLVQVDGSQDAKIEVQHKQRSAAHVTSGQADGRVCELTFGVGESGGQVCALLRRCTCGTPRLENRDSHPAEPFTQDRRPVVCQAHMRYGKTWGAFCWWVVKMAWCSMNPQALMWSWSAPMSSSANWKFALGPTPTCLGSDDSREGGEEFHNDRTRDDIDEGLLECDGSVLLVGSPAVLVCCDGQELCPDCRCGVVEVAIGSLLTPLGEGVRSVARLMEACKWSLFHLLWFESRV